MKRSIILAALLAVVAVGFGGSAVSAEDWQQDVAAFDAKLRPVMDQMIQKRAELARLYNSGTVDQEKMQTLNREIADLQTQAYMIHQEYAGTMQNGGWACPGFGGSGCQFGGMGGGYGMGMRGGYGMGHRGGMGYGRGMGYGHRGGMRGGMRGGWGGGHHGGGHW